MRRGSSRRSSGSATAPERNSEAALIALLPPAERLALAYAPRSARGGTLALMALDARLAGIVRATTEPLLGQMRLAWWRDRLREDAASWPAGEPVLAALVEWGGQAKALDAMIDGWEELIGERPLTAEAFARSAAGRAAGWSALAAHLSCAGGGEIAQAAGGWALADLAAHLSDEDEHETVLALLAKRDWPAIRLARPLRPLAVLYALARKTKGGALLSGPAVLATALRVGIAGR